MQLYIKTPFFEDNKYLPHLLEHCSLHSPQRAEFFKFFGAVSAYTDYGATNFSWDEGLSLLELLNKIQQPVLEETFLSQKALLEQELSDSSPYQLWGEKLYQLISNNANISANTVVPTIQLTDLHHYQTQRYQTENMILVDEIGEIDLQFGMGENLQPFEGSFDLSQLQYTYLDHQDIAEHVLYLPYQQQANQILSLDFLEALLSAWIFWENNQKNQYFQELFELIVSDEFIILSWPEGEAFPSVSEDFFTFYQQLYIQKLQHHQMRGFIPKIALHTRNYISITAQQNFIQKISYSEIEKAIAEIQQHQQ